MAIRRLLIGASCLLIVGCAGVGPAGPLPSDRGLLPSWCAFLIGLAGVCFPDLFDFGGLGERKITRALSAAILFYGSVMLASIYQLI